MLALLAPFAPVAKALAGFAAGALTGTGTAYTVAPDADMTLTGYLVVGALNGAIAFATVYFAPANRARLY